MIFIDLVVSGGWKIMKIGGNSNKKCKDRLGKPKIGPETEKIGEKTEKNA